MTISLVSVLLSLGHARYNFPLFNLYGYLSVSGTYGSDEICLNYCMNSHSVPVSYLLNRYSLLLKSCKPKVNDDVCRVDFDEAWLRTFDNDDSFEEGPYPDVTSVPDSISKTLIRNIGRALFIEPFAVFPVSYLDNELIVFDFELLGTRICARKETY